MRQVMCAALLSAAVLLGGCNQERSLYAVRMSGDEAIVKGDTQRAVTDFAEYVARAPERPEGRLGYGRALLAAGRAGEAVEQLWIARANMLTDDVAYEALVEALYQDKQYEPMYGVLRERIVDGGEAKDHLRFGRYAMKIGDTDQALRSFRTAARIDAGQTIEPQLALAEFYQVVGNNEEALKRLRMAYYIAPDSKVVCDKIRLMGEIPGPTIRLRPEEAPVETVEAQGG